MHWTENVPENPETWMCFPPLNEEPRREAWEHNKQIFRGRHGDVFKEVKFLQERLERAKVLDVLRDAQEQSCTLYITANYCGLLSRTCASLLFGEGIKVTPLAEGESEKENINRILENNQLQRLNLLQARTASAQGYTFYRVRWGKQPGWHEEAAIIEAIPGYNVFPHVSSDNIKEATGYTIATVIKYGDEKYLRREIHKVGRVENKLNVMSGTEIGHEVPLSTIPELANILPVWVNEYPGLFVEYVPNLESIDEFWGISDYEDIEGVQDAINNRISHIDEILDKHTNPLLVLPSGIMRYDGNSKQYYALKEDLDTIEMNADDAGNLPRYVVWDAQLKAAFDEIDQLMELAMLVSQMSPAVFGGTKSYSAAESGRALKLRMIQTLAKINDKRLPFDAALKNVIYAAQWLEKRFGKVGTPEPQSVQIEWRDGLPDDELEQAQIHATLISSNMESRHNAVKAIQGLEAESLTEELGRIEDELTINASAYGI